MILNKSFKIKINNPQNPNESMGNIIEFYNESNEPVAHFSLTWESQIWFGYYSHVEKKWFDFKHMYYFNFFEQEYLYVDISIVDFEMMISVNNVICKKKMDISFAYSHYRVGKDFDDAAKNTNLLCNIEEVESKNLYLDPIEFTFDIIMCSYENSVMEKICIDSLYHTYDVNKFPKIKDFIFVDNNKHNEGYDNFLYFKNKYSEISNFVYINNPDKSYCSNRCSGSVLGAKQSSADYALFIDSDVFFVNNKWQEELKDVTKTGSSVAGVYVFPGNTNRIRCFSILIPRLSPAFLIVQKVFLQEKILEDENIFNDCILESQYKNLKINIGGFHFSKLFLSALNDNKNIFLFHWYFMIYPPFESGLIDEIGLMHFIGLSFQEAWNPECFNNKKKDILAMLNMCGYNEFILGCKNKIEAEYVY